MTSVHRMPIRPAIKLVVLGLVTLLQITGASSLVMSASRQKLCGNTTMGFKPLPELGVSLYKDQQGGLYPGGGNSRPAQHEEAGLALSHQVQPLSIYGQSDKASGKIVLLTIGMSNTTQESAAFIKLAAHDKDINPQVVIVDGAQGGMDTTKIIDKANSGTGERYWSTIRQRLVAAHVTQAQVQVVWMKEAVIGPTLPFPADAISLCDQLRTIMQKVKTEFPNCKMVYLSSRVYAGYAATNLNPEPFSYQSGFAVKWLVEEQISGSAALNYNPERGAVNAPWISWGPYLWVDGLTPRADGLVWECSDTANDGTHPSDSGRAKVAQMLLSFFKTDSTTKSWFLSPTSAQ